jgi:hypothetical protein
MSKMGSHDPFGHLKHKLWPNEGSGVKLPIWLLTTKSQKSPQFHCVKVVCHISLEISRQGLQLCFRPYLNQRSAHKVMGPQNHKNPNFGNFETPTGSLETKWHLGVGFMAMQKVYYKGEGGSFPQVRTMVSFVNPCLFMTCHYTKVLQLHINQLVVWFV